MRWWVSYDLKTRNYFSLKSSSGQIEANGTRGVREPYNVSQEIRDLVPVDFAAANLRKSFFKYQSDKNILQYDQYANESPENSIGKRISFMERPTEKYQENENRRNGITGSRKRSNQYSPSGHKHASGFRSNRFQTVTSTEKSTSMIRRSQTQSAVRSNVIRRKSVNSFENIKKAINALPQQMVKVVRDDIDCIDDPRTKNHDVRGPPCTFSARWPGSGGNPWFWLNNVVPDNWELFLQLR